MSELAVTWAQ